MHNFRKKNNYPWLRVRITVKLQELSIEMDYMTKTFHEFSLLLFNSKKTFLFNSLFVHKFTFQYFDNFRFFSRHPVIFMAMLVNQRILDHAFSCPFGKISVSGMYNVRFNGLHMRLSVLLIYIVFR